MPVRKKVEQPILRCNINGGSKIPKTQIRNQKRNVEIIRRNHEGESPKIIARDLCLSVWAVYKIYRRAQSSEYPKNKRRSVKSLRTS